MSKSLMGRFVLDSNWFEADKFNVVANRFLTFARQYALQPFLLDEKRGSYFSYSSSQGSCELC